MVNLASIGERVKWKHIRGDRHQRQTEPEDSAEQRAPIASALLTAFEPAVIAGVFTGTLATAVEILSWWGFGSAALDMLLRDARLAAAIVSGHGVLPPPSIVNWHVMFAATLVHFTRSIVYAGPLLSRVRGRRLRS